MGIFNHIKSLTGLKKKEETKKVVEKPKAAKVVKKASRKITKKTKKKTIKPVKQKDKKTDSKPVKSILTKKAKKKTAKPVKKQVKKIKAGREIKPKKLSVKKKTAKKIIKKTKKARSKKPAKPKKPKMEFKQMSKAGALKLIARIDAIDFIMCVAGEEGLKVMNFLFKHGKEIDEFTLAEKVDLQINFVRSLLYKLYEKKLVSFSRERDKQKGWFIYSWESHPDRLKEILLIEKDLEIAKLKEGMLTVQQVFFCNSCGKSYDYVQAMENTFFCAECGNALEGLDSKGLREKVNIKIVKLLKDKNEINAL